MQKNKISQGALIKRSWGRAFDVIFGVNKITIPFVVIALLELIGIVVIFVVIQPPLAKYITPIVIRF